MNKLLSYSTVLARILIALIFILSGVSKISGFQATVAYIASAGVPLAAIAAVAAIVVELGGGILLVLGYRAQIAAFLMAGFTVLAALIFHQFWAVPEADMQNQMIHFMKNLSIAGGLLMIVIHGSSAPRATSNQK